MTSGNPKHKRKGGLSDHIPDRGKQINIHGWYISEIGYQVLVNVLGKHGADQHCKTMASRPCE